MNKICDKLVVVVPDGLTDAQITSVDDYISSLPYIDPLVNRVLYVLQVGFDEIIYVLGRDGKNIVGVTQDREQRVFKTREILRHAQSGDGWLKIYMGDLGLLDDVLEALHNRQDCDYLFDTRDVTWVVSPTGVLHAILYEMARLSPVSRPDALINDGDAKFLVTFGNANVIIGGSYLNHGVKEPFGWVCHKGRKPGELYYLLDLVEYNGLRNAKVIKSNLGSIKDEVARARAGLGVQKEVYAPTSDIVAAAAREGFHISKDEAKALCDAADEFGIRVRIENNTAILTFADGTWRELSVMEAIRTVWLKAYRAHILAKPLKDLLDYGLPVEGERSMFK